MKIKKIKNLILTFVICLFGALVFNSIETKAGYFYNYFTYNELDIYHNTGTGAPNNYLYITGNSAGSVFSINYVDANAYRNIQYNNCSWSPNTGAFTGNLLVGVFNCTGYYITNYGSGTETNTNYTSRFELRTTANNSNTIYSVYSSYLVAPFGGGVNYAYERRLDSEYYDEIYNSGYDWGYDRGYEDALEDSVDVNRNSLVGMIGAIFTGPVTMLQSVFNFNILGVNFAEMLLGLTTLLVVIWLVKRFI